MQENPIRDPPSPMDDEVGSPAISEASVGSIVSTTSVDSVGSPASVGSTGSPGGKKWYGCVDHFVPDSEAKACPRCSKSFGTMRRKHHCRVCGGVFCSTCSKSKREVHPEESPGWSGKQRVCDGCVTAVEPGPGSALTAAQFCLVAKETPVFKTSLLPRGDPIATLKPNDMVEILSPLDIDYAGVSWCQVPQGWVAPGGMEEKNEQQLAVEFKLLQKHKDVDPDAHLVQILGGDNIRKAQEHIKKESEFAAAQQGGGGGGGGGGGIPAAEPDSTVVVVFTEQGSVGLELAEKPGPKVEVAVIKPGTQATQHASLQPGLVITHVAGEDMAGKTLDDVFDVIIAHPERPLEFRFAGNAALLANVSIDVSELDPMSAPAPAPAPASRPASAPARSPPASAKPDGEIAVVFTQDGSVGLELTEEKNQVSIKDVRAGTQATSHAALRPGLVITHVAGEDMAGKSLDDVFAVIIAHPERPLEFRFAAPAGGSAADAAKAAKQAERQRMQAEVSTAPAPADPYAPPCCLSRPASLKGRGAVHSKRRRRQPCSRSSKSRKRKKQRRGGRSPTWPREAAGVCRWTSRWRWPRRSTSRRKSRRSPLRRRRRCAATPRPCPCSLIWRLRTSLDRERC